MSLPVITIAQMREWEAATWATGRTEAEVIEHVGRAVASRALEMTRPGQHVVILAGKGNNGEDARKAAAHLKDRKVEVVDVVEPEEAGQRLKVVLGRRPALVIDALFGIGLNRELSKPWVELIGNVNAYDLNVLAVDLPSGLNGDTGEHYGAAIRADVTLTVGAPKVGLLAPAAWPWTGRVEVVSDVGLVPCSASSELQWTMPREDFVGLPGRRLVASHKGTYGHLGIVAGSLGYHGAAVLAARAAQRGQTGLITLHTADQVYQAVASQLQAVMVSPFRTGFKLPANYTAHLIGPGLAAPEMRDIVAPIVRQLWRDSILPLVIDASGLDLLPMDPPARQGLRVLTPHPGEAARLLRCSAEQVQSNRVAAVRNLSKRHGNAWIVLKGHHTCIGRASGEVYVNGSGNPHMAQGGSGDVLAGFMASLLAQPELAKDALKTIRYAVWRHGEAADKLQDSGARWVVEDLAESVGD